MLTDTAIRALRAGDKDLLLPAGGRLGLYLRVRAASGRKLWVIRRRTGGAWRVETIGEWPKMTARAAQAVAAGSPDAPAAVLTFKDIIPDFRREVIDRRYTSAPGDFAAYLTRDCTPLLTKRLSRIRSADIANVVTAKAATPNSATKLLVLLKQLFGWAVLTGRLEVDPSAGLTAKRLDLPGYRPRERTLTDDELRKLWTLPDEPYGRLLRFALLTACRIGEAQKLQPDQVVDAVWRIPPENTKARRAHTVPLSATAAGLAEQGWPPRAYKSLHSYMQAQAFTWRVHDLRRTAATRMRDAGVAIETIEAVLNHAPPRLVRVYQRPDMLPAMRDAVDRLEAAVLAVVKCPDA
jgi:integrase